jgi:preprotein translocase subunit YajC
MIPLTILLQAPTGLTQALPQILLWVGILGVFYFFMIRPQQQKQKELRSFVDNLKKGQEVVTIGGLHGKIVSINEKLIVLEVDKTTRLTFEKSSIARDASTPAVAEKTSLF